MLLLIHVEHYLILLSLLPGCLGFFEVNLVLQEGDVPLVMLQPGLRLGNLPHRHIFSTLAAYSLHVQLRYSLLQGPVVAKFRSSSSHLRHWHRMRSMQA